MEVQSKVNIVGLGLHQNIGHLEVCQQQTAGFFTIPSHGSQPPLLYLTKNTAVLPEQCFLHKVCVRDVAPAAHRATSFIRLPHAHSSCQPNRLQQSQPGPYMRAWEKMSITQTSYLLDRQKYLQWGFCRQGSLSHTTQDRHHSSSREGPAALQLFFFLPFQSRSVAVLWPLKITHGI